MAAAILLFLKANWKLVAVAVFVTSLAGYIEFLRLEVSHYESKVLTLQAAIDDAVIRRKNAEAIAKQRSDEITKTHEESLKRENDLIDANNKLVKDKINANEELKRIKLSLNLVQLWNSSKQPQPALTAAEQGNAGKADPAQTFDLSQLFAVSAENDANHLKCVQQVLDWQSFWQEYVTSKEEADAASGHSN